MDKDLLLAEAFLNFALAEKGLAKSSISSYRFDLIHFLKFLGGAGKILSEVIYLDVLAFFEAEVMEKEIESSSQLRKISVLFNFYEFLVREKGFTYNPVKELERPIKNESLPIFLEKEETQKLLAFASKDLSKKGIRDFAILQLLYSSGMRISECLSLPLSAILKFKDKIKEETIIKGKGERERIIFINSAARNALGEYLQVRRAFTKSESKFLFNSNSREGYLSRQNFFYSLKKIGYKAGLDYTRVSPHKIRHSFATYLFLNGIDIRILQEMLGHADISTTQFYTHINSAGLKTTVETFHPLAGNFYTKP